MKTFIDGDPTPEMVFRRERTLQRLELNSGRWKDLLTLARAVYESAYDEAVLYARHDQNAGPQGGPDRA